MTQDDVAAFFDAEAARYDAAHDEATAAGHVLRARMDAVLAALGARPGEVLDVGMGPGRLLAALDRGGWTVSGIDASREMVARARERLPDARERLLHGRVEALPFPAASFDAVVATGVLEYVPDRAGAVTEVSRVLRPGGLLVAAIPNTAAVHRAVRRYLCYPAVRALKRRLGGARPAPLRREALRHRELADVLAGAGLEVESARYVGFAALPPPVDAFLPRLAVALAERLERSQRPRLLATQLVLAARKDALPG